MRSYCGYAGALGRGTHVAANVVSDLQRDLRALGYHDGEISGVWGPGLDAAVRAVRYDLVHGGATSVVGAYNAGGAVTAAPATGPAEIEPALAACIRAMSEDAAFVKLPFSLNVAADNQTAWSSVTAVRGAAAPTPFLAAIFQQESGGRHFHLPSQANHDNFVTVGLDRNDRAAPERITSRGYGVGRDTLFHHPPTLAELSDVIIDPAANAREAFVMVRDKFDHDVVSNDPSRRADDRHAEWPFAPLRLCKYPGTDPRFLTDCKACAARAGSVAISPGRPVYPGAALTWTPTSYYPSAVYASVPDRTGFPCDWPYAVRRYNGGGINSYHYQMRVLCNLLTLT